MPDRMILKPAKDTAKAISYAVCTVFASSLLTGCVALLPFIEQDGGRPVKVGTVDSTCPLTGMKYASAKAYPVSSDAPARRRAARGPSRQARISQLIKQLQEGNDVARTHAATDLGSFGALAEPAVEPLSHALLHDESKWVRRASAKSLGKIGTPEVIRPLRIALNDSDKWVAHSVTNVLRKLGEPVEIRATQVQTVTAAATVGPAESALQPAAASTFEVRGNSVKKF